MFGERFKELRMAMGVNQVEIAKTLLVSKQSVSNWENNNILPSLDVLVRIASTFHVSSDYLLGLDDGRTLNVSGLSSAQIAHLQALIDDLNKGE